MRHESCARITAEGDLPGPGQGEHRRVGLVFRETVQEQERGAAVQRRVPHRGLQERPALRGGEKLRVTQGTVPLQDGGCGSERQGDEPLESDSLRVTDK